MSEHHRTEFLWNVELNQKKQTMQLNAKPTHILVCITLYFPVFWGPTYFDSKGMATLGGCSHMQMQMHMNM